MCIIIIKILVILTNFFLQLKEANFFHQKNGHRESSLPNNWKGQNGVYSVGFTAQGLLGASMDAHKVAEDIAQHWNSATEKYCLDA